MNDVIQYERDFVVQTKTRHQTPIVHTTSIIAGSGSGSGSSNEEKVAASRIHSRHSSMDRAPLTVTRAKRSLMKHVHDPVPENASASAMCDSESSLSAGTLHCCSGFPVSPDICGCMMVKTMDSHQVNRHPHSIAAVTHMSQARPTFIPCFRKNICYTHWHIQCLDRILKALGHLFLHLFRTLTIVGVPTHNFCFSVKMALSLLCPRLLGGGIKQ